MRVFQARPIGHHRAANAARLRRSITAHFFFYRRPPALARPPAAGREMVVAAVSQVTNRPPPRQNTRYAPLATRRRRWRRAPRPEDARPGLGTVSEPQIWTRGRPVGPIANHRTGPGLGTVRCSILGYEHGVGLAGPIENGPS